jgi:hypothetical protein
VGIAQRQVVGGFFFRARSLGLSPKLSGSAIWGAESLPAIPRNSIAFLEPYVEENIFFVLDYEIFLSWFCTKLVYEYIKYLY